MQEWALSKLPLGPTLYPKEYSSDKSLRWFVSEIIREQVFMQYKEEVPYCTTVVIEEYIEQIDDRDYIHAAIICESKHHVPILLGKAGRSLRILTAASRVAVEEWLGK